MLELIKSRNKNEKRKIKHFFVFQNNTLELLTLGSNLSQGSKTSCLC